MSVGTDDPDVATDWEAPAPLSFAGKRPPFPGHLLPDWMGEFVEATAIATQTPEDLSGCLVLAVLATAAGGRSVVEVRPGWREPTNLYVAVAMEPGERKTPVFQRCTAPIAAVEAEMVKEVSDEISRLSVERKVAQDAAAKAQRDAARLEGNEGEAAMKRAFELAGMAESITVPVSPRLLADDATPEALAGLMAEQGGRMAILSDEGDLFEIMAGRYSRDPNLGIYLKAHSGSQYRVDRKGRPPEFIKNPALTLGLAVQPAVLRSIATKPGFRGKGLLARFLWSLPASPLGRRQINPPPVPEAVTDAYSANVGDLVRSLAKWTDPAVLVFTVEASDALAAFEAAIEPRLGPGGDLRVIADWTAKLVGHIVRIAALLHIADDTTPDAWKVPIEATIVEAAVEFGRYFLGHALATFDHMGADPRVHAAKTLGEWVRVRQTFSVRDAYRSHQNLFPKVEMIEPVFALLVDAGWIRSKLQDDKAPKARPGRPPSPVFEVNPRLSR